MKFLLHAIPLSLKKCHSGFLIALIAFTATLSFAQAPSTNWSDEFDGNRSFIENKGQFDGRDKISGSEILYGIDNSEMQIFFTKEGVTYRFDERYRNPNRKKGEFMKPKYLKKTELIHFIWEGANPDVELTGLGMMQDYHVYSFPTADRSSVYTIDNVRGYKKLVYHDVYPGIDIEYTFHAQGGIKYSVILHPGADPSVVRLKYAADANISLERTGKIIIPTLFGDLVEHAPVTFYAGNSNAVIASRFMKEDKTISFVLGDYNRQRRVVIDPWVQTPSLPNSNGVWECEKDGAGNAYIIGGDSPMKLLKYNTAGVLQWTYTTPYDTLNNWLGTFATDLAGNSYVTSGSIAAMQKVNTNGGLVWNYNAPLFSSNEYWSIAFNCDQTKLVVGGTTAGGSFLAGAIFDINTTNGNVLNTQIVGYGSAFGIPIDIQEVRAITSSRNAKYYFLTLDTIGAINQNLAACSSVPLFKTNSTYNLSYKCENYRPANGNSGICAIRANNNFAYTQNGTNVHKRSPTTGAIITTAAIPGGISITDPFFGVNQVGNSGIDLDDCGNVYVGSGDRVVKYDANLNFITSVALPFRVYDVTVSYNGEIIVAGATGNNSIPNRTGYAQVINMAACAPFSLICCDATVCPAGPYCTSDAPFNLTPVQPGGTWSGPGITNTVTGTFDPAVAGAGTHSISYSLSCGSETVSITVNSCATLSVCVESNGQYTVSGSTEPYTWEHGVPFQNCTACPFGICFPIICPGFSDTTWTTFGTTPTVTPPGTFPIRVRDSGINSLQIDTSLGLPSCGPICPTITVSIVSQRDVSCFRFNDGSATVAATGGLAPYTYIWQPGSLTGPTQNNLTPGLYGILASDANRCTGTATVTITSPNELVLSPSQTNASCAGNDGAASVLPSGGTPSYRYSWSNSATTPSISNLQAGTYTVTVNDANSCSVTASFTITSPQDAFSSQDVSICDGESFFAGGGFQTVSGAYYDTLTAANGCDSVVTTNLTVLLAALSNQSVSICQGDSFFVGGAFQTTAGTYIDTLVGANGCDSILTTNLTVLQNISENVDAFICDGDAYFAGGTFQTTTGTYYDTLIATGGCDSVVITNLTVLPNYTINQDVSICDGENYFAGGGNQTTTGIYHDSLLASTGCDSVLVTNLTVLPLSSATQNASICDGDSLLAGGAFQTTSGIYFDTLVAANGCDSIVTTNLTVLLNISVNVDASICDGDGYFAGGDFQTEAGTYYDTLAASAGCDSIVITNLTVLPNYSDTLDVSICDGQSYFAGGANQTTSGTYYDSLLASTGCDSVLITNLTVLPAPVTNQDVSICDGDSYFAGGGFQTTSGLYYDTLTSSGGCDSIVVTNLSVLANVSDSVDVSICDGEVYFVGGAFQTTAGTYYDTLTASGGCDSIVVTKLTVLPPVVAAFTVSSNTICVAQSVSFTNGSTNASSYLWDFGDGNTSTTQDPTITYTSIGIFAVTLRATDSNGCENSVSSNITVGTESLTVIDASICDGESYFAGGGFQTESGSYFDTLVTSGGCDSIVTTNLTVLPHSSIILDVSICDGESYFAGGGFQTEAGTYYDTLAAANGCDSIVTTNLIVLLHSSTILDASICEGESYFAGGGFQTEAGTYYDTLAAANGCDSIVTTNLIVLLHSSTILDASICEGESYFAGGGFQTTAGTYFDTLTVANGCDSIVTTNLIVLPHSSTILDASICDGESYFAGGGFQTVAGAYFDTLTAANGCDSVLTTNLTILPNSNTVINVSICNGESYFAGGTFQTEKGTYFDTLAAANGCDSIVVTNLDVLPIPRTTQSASICDGESYFVGGGDQTTAGTYYDTLIAANGCDSIVETTLIILLHSFTILDANICEGESYLTGGGFQTETGSYFDTLIAANGCDSIITTNLTVHPNASTTIDATICDGSGYFAGGAIQTTSGTYHDTLTTSFGCDSVIITNLNFSTSIGFTFNITDASCNGLCDGAAECTVSGGQEPLTFSWSNGGTAALNDNLCADTYGITATDANGCSAESFATVGEPEPLTAAITQHNISCNCANSLANQGICVIDFAGLPAGTVLNEQYAQFGIHISGDVHNSSSLDKLIVFNSNATGTPDPDLQVGVGNLAILPQNLIDLNGDGLIDAPNDNNLGGKQIYTFDTPRDVISFKFIDKENPPGTATAYDDNGTVIKSVTIPSGGNGSIQTITINAQGVSRLEIDYRYDSGGVTEITLGCTLQCCDAEASSEPVGGTLPYSFEWSNGSTQQSITNLCAGNYDVTVTDANGCQFSTSVLISEFEDIEVTVPHTDATANCAPLNQLCELDFGGLPAGTKLNEQYAQFGIHISGDAYGSFPDQIIIFDADASGTPDPDLEPASGHLAIFPERLNDNNGDGLVDIPNDQSAGGKMTFTFDQEREVISFVYVDKDNNNPSFAKAYDANNNLIKTVNIPNRGDGSVQTVVVNATGVRKLVIDYRGSGGVTSIVFGCSVTCCDGSASASASGGSPPFTYEWSNGATTASVDSLCAGTYTVTVTDAEGCASEQTIVIGDCQLSIAGMMLVHDGFSADIAPLNDGDVISLDTLCPFNIRAILCQSSIGSVKYKINGVHYRVEEYEPYALAGDNPTGNYHPWIPEPGDYTVEATPYSGMNATGNAGSTFTIHFTIAGEPCGAFKTAAGNHSDAFEIEAYPIPFNEKIMVDVTAKSASQATLRVMDMLGVEVARQNVGLTEGMNTIKIASGDWMPSAIYFLEVRVNEQMRVVKLVKVNK